MLSNLDLVREFVGNSIHKKDILLANRCLTAQTVYNINHLTAKAEGLIATAQLNIPESEFLILANSSHWELLNQALAEYNYLLKGNIDSYGFYRYQYCQIPKGYRLECTKSVLLWRAWWKYRKNALGAEIPSALLIQARDSWYPIRDLMISDGLIYVKTLVGEIQIHADDLVIWLSKIEAPRQPKHSLHDDPISTIQVIINADEKVDYGRVVAVMDRGRKVEGAKLAIATKK